MKILHIIDELKTGGAQTHLFTVLSEAVQIEEDRHFVVSLFNDGPIGDQIRALGIPTQSLDLRTTAGKRELLRGMGLLRELVAEIVPDVVEAHLTWSRLLGLPVAWWKRVPRRIGFEQGDLYMTSPLIRSANFLGQVFAQKIVVCSQALADWAHRTHGFKRKRMVVIHNCVDVSRFRPDLVAASDVSSRTLAAATKICTVGTLGKGVNKRVDVAIRAVAFARRKGADVGLVVCGEGELRADLERLADSEGVEGFVAFLGMRSDVPEILAGCQGLCHTAPFEPFGIVCLEAMACSLPVLIPASGGIQEAVTDGETGLLYPALDHEALGTLMIKIQRDKELASRLGAAARVVVEEDFSVRNYTRRLLDLYAGSERMGRRSA